MARRQQLGSSARYGADYREWSVSGVLPLSPHSRDASLVTSLVSALPPFRGDARVAARTDSAAG
jgi:hypothetical protein